MKKNNFRYDINGLRAYAVSLVILFHFGVMGFSAGFIGVDIFFVISGFLMTKIIVDQLLEQRFSFLQFYISRAIRILRAYRDWETDRKSTRLNSSHLKLSRMPSSA